MTHFKDRIHRLALGFLLAGTLPWLAGCDETEYDYDPPAGQGSLVVDNFTGERIDVFIDGLEVDRVSSGKHRYYDLEPGVHRVAFDGDDSDRFWAEDVDILEERLTVLEVEANYDGTGTFAVRIHFD